MPAPLVPGTYVQETPSSTSIKPSPTSRTAFLGTAGQGPVGSPVTVRSINDLRSTFGGPDKGNLFPAVELFMANGGTEAVVVRLCKPAAFVGPSKLPSAIRPSIGQDRTRVIGGAEYQGTESDSLDASCFIGGGIRALDSAEFGLLYIPPYLTDRNVDPEVLTAAARYCYERRAMLLIDAPRSWSNVSTAEADARNMRSALGSYAVNAALYHPWLKRRSSSGAIVEVPPGAAAAGIIARTDAQRGVWKAPAGTEAKVLAVEGTNIAVSDSDTDHLGSAGVNCLRTMPGMGTVIWGARTLDNGMGQGSEAKYLPVRRLFMYIESSVALGLQWTMFEPNGPALWSTVRSSIEEFMLGLFRQGAFQGTKPEEAFFIRCGADTTSQDDLAKGALNVQMGFAPLKPAEFIILRSQVRTATGL